LRHPPPFPTRRSSHLNPLSSSCALVKSIYVGLTPFPAPGVPMATFFYTPASFLRPRHDVRHAREDSAIAAWADVVFLSPSCSHAAQNIRTPKIPRWSFDGLCAKECCAVTRQGTWFYKALFAPP